MAHFIAACKSIGDATAIRNMRVQVQPCQQFGMYDCNSESNFSRFIEICPVNYYKILLDISFESFPRARV